MRRSPIRHEVGSYKRKNGTRVSSHHRGSGIRTLRSNKVVSRNGLTFPEPHGFTLNFKYSDRPGDGESVYVISDNYTNALDEGNEERVDPRVPIGIEVIDPSIGEMVKVLGSKVKGAVKWGAPIVLSAGRAGAKYAIKATMISGRTLKNAAKSVGHMAKETGRLAAYEGQKHIIQGLLNQCYKGTKAQKIAARNALKNNFREIYDMCDFSRERRRKAPQVYTIDPRMIGQRNY